MLQFLRILLYEWQYTSQHIVAQSMVVVIFLADCEKILTVNVLLFLSLAVALVIAWLFRFYQSFCVFIHSSQKRVFERCRQLEAVGCLRVNVKIPVWSNLLSWVFVICMVELKGTAKTEALMLLKHRGIVIYECILITVINVII